MSIYECPRAEDAAGYVLRALPEGEWESYRYHVAKCDDCTQKVAELGFVSHALLSAVPQLSAPSEIRNRVMSVVRAESELLQAAGATADRPTPKPARRRGFGFGRLGPLTTGALAAALLVIGLGAGALLRDDASCTTRAASLTIPGSKAELELCDGSARLALSGMPAPPEDRIYELWLDDPNDRFGPQPAALFSVRNGKASVDVGKLRGHQRVLVTHEPLPNGSEVPSMQPVVKVVA
ncbi:MAG TPA: anti-sigma factor [Solirubrobacteraceae bacterium]|nr:anti-sigma factor [Solirubrobacteraceae bacterium]